MAEKGFGVKEVNLIGASGTPTIESPNNLNLNAVNVAISTNVSIGGTLTVTGNVSVGGTLTYEDVTNIDSVGLITARNGIDCNGDIDVDGHTNLDNVSIAGVTTAAGNINVSGDIVINSTGPKISLNDTNNNPDYDILNTDGTFQVNDTSNGAVRFRINDGGRVDILQNLDVGSNIKLGNAGVVTATSFSGSGANLTGIAVTEAPVTDYTITGDGSHYYFHGGGVDETAGDPDLYLIRGQKYRFNNTTGSSHPFEFRVSSGGSAYSNGVSGDDEGVQFFTVPYDAPPSIVYQCTAHSGMVGNIYISGGQYHTRPNNLCLQYTPNGSFNVTTGTVIYATEVFDVGDSNAYNTSNGEFTAPVTGVYRIQYEHFASGAGRATAQIQKHDGSSWSTVKNGMRVYSTASGSDWTSVPTIFYLQLNATEKFKIIHAEGTIHLNTPWNHMTVQLVQ